ncbi:hypothetical protein AVEN_18224-1 [Araneus ventricosus]|uniref:Uncharacterized protein n=1 Tax=Araneus ventricosus TaxID=182803 RepID=A0A4Y2AIX7_ARAVE|nr:hypothetical protein AVEN_18224-1 [Araneus ventricosus]
MLLLLNCFLEALLVATLSESRHENYMHSFVQISGIILLEGYQKFLDIFNKINIVLPKAISYSCSIGNTSASRGDYSKVLAALKAGNIATVMGISLFRLEQVSTYLFMNCIKVD